MSCFKHWDVIQSIKVHCTSPVYLPLLDCTMASLLAKRAPIAGRSTPVAHALTSKPVLLRKPTPIANPILSSVSIGSHAAHLRTQPAIICKAAEETNTPTATQQNGLVGEDAAAFELSKQSLTSWGLFVGLLTGVMGLLYLVSAWQQRIVVDTSLMSDHTISPAT